MSPSDDLLTLFPASNRETRIRLAGIVQSYPAGVSLFEQGQPCRMIFGVLSGRVARIARREARSSLMDLVGPGAVLGAEAALAATPYGFTGRAVTGVTVLAMGAAPFLDQFAEDFGFAKDVARHLAQDRAAVFGAWADAKLKTASERLAAWLLAELGHAGEGALAKLPLPKIEIASLMGTTPVYITKAFNDLAAYGVETKGKYVILHDLRRLAAFAAGP
ncbi:hypothetical protein SLNSH_19600 [Alsobacter soli]|uniref:Crp/Fnr family transcriptional regulator n=1 Tax=Alsobacter soli TaxID=2109933 RepID=A0A2T1HNN6_9HYPH|nr:cyclic nucleotide-binding domain-containing protein [Alsobacter soli]PSC03265.1 hypothetical protein SLNSH_19600 [Alsobacter soli]